MRTTMDEDGLIFDVNEEFAFGQEENDTDLIFTEYSAAARSQSATWQRIVEMKSAAHEGFLSYHILAEREQEGLPVYAKSLFSIHSPIENLARETDLFSGSVKSRGNFIEHRQEVIAKLDDLIVASTRGSQFAFKFAEVRELLAMQLYGFGRAALQEDELPLCLDAFRVAGVMRKDKVVVLLRDYVAENPMSEEVIKEYIHFHI